MTDWLTGDAVQEACRTHASSVCRLSRQSFRVRALAAAAPTCRRRPCGISPCVRVALRLSPRCWSCSPVPPSEYCSTRVWRARDLQKFVVVRLIARIDILVDVRQGAVLLYEKRHSLAVSPGFAEGSVRADNLAVRVRHERKRQSALRGCPRIAVGSQGRRR